MKGKRSYQHYCSIAKALEILGERWTLLIVRDLLIGGRRFKDLTESLPGIGTNLLSARLKELEAEGLIQKEVLPPPAGSTIYVLTSRGRELEPVLDALTKWGFGLMRKPKKNEVWMPHWTLLGMKNSFRADRAKGIEKVFQFVIDKESYYAEVRDQKASISTGIHPHPDLTVTTDRETFLMGATHQLDFKKALREKKYALRGTESDFMKFLELFALNV